MLDDHAVSYGRQTNGKYIILLMLLALASLLGAWAMEHKGEVQSPGSAAARNAAAHGLAGCAK